MKKGWQTKTLGEIGKISMCKRIFKEETTATGDIPFYKIGTFGKEPDAFIPNQTYNEYRSKYPFPKKGDVLISASGTIGRRVRYDGEPAYFQDSNIVWIVNDEKQVLNDYLYYFYGACEWNSTKGSTISRLYNDDLRRIAIRFPESLAEQQRIVGVLDKAFAGLAIAKANAEKNLQNARALFESLLTTAMSGKLTKEWRKSHPHVETGSELLDQILAKRRRAWSKKGEYPEPTPSSKNDSQSIPSSWTWTNLSQLKTFSLYGPRFSNDDYSQTGVLVLRTSDIDEHGKVNSDTAPKLKMTEAEFDKYRCKKGDLLITRTGSLGTLAVFDDDTRAIPGAYLIQFRLGFSEVIPWFLFAFFKSPAAQARLTSGGTGAGIQNLNVPTLEAIPLPFPPIDEQREIVSQLNTLAQETQRLARLYKQKLAALDELKKSLLHQAFSGEL